MMLTPYGVASRSYSVKPSFASTRREMTFRSQTDAPSRSWPDTAARSSTAHPASVA
jgi:hypothetical protein